MAIQDKCSRRKCGWIGTDDDKKPVLNRKWSARGLKVNDLVCPKCGYKEFYELRKGERTDKTAVTSGVN